MKNTTLCYLETNDHYLMLHRTKKEEDENKGKWIGVGGKFLEGESPEECLCREVLEETGLVLTNYRFRGLVTFISDKWGTEYMHLFTADGFYPEGEEEAYYAAVNAYEEELKKQEEPEEEEKPRYSRDIVAAREAAETAEIVDRIVARVIDQSAEEDTKEADADAVDTESVNTEMTNAESASGESSNTELAGDESANGESANAESTSDGAVSSDTQSAEGLNALKLKDCPEGELRWIHKDELFQLNMWEGDHKFLKLLIEEAPFFTMTLLYQGDDLVDCDTHIYG